MLKTSIETPSTEKSGQKSDPKKSKNEEKQKYPKSIFAKVLFSIEENGFQKMYQQILKKSKEGITQGVAEGVAEYRVGEDTDFGSGILISSIVQQACRYPPQILEIDQAYATGFCLTTDQLYCFSEKLSRCFPKMIFTYLKFMS